MVEIRSEAFPRVLSRAAGVLYLLIILIGVSEAVVRDRVVVAGDAAATAANLRSMEWLWRASAAGEFVLLLCGISLTPILYYLLRPVSRYFALLMMCLNIVSLAVEAVAGLFLVVALLPLGDAAYLRAFEPAQLEAMARMSIRLHNLGFGMALIFFGAVCVVIGSLIVRSGIVPKIIGVLMQLAGVSYLISNFAMILSPAFSNRLFPFILLPPLIGESALCLWLLIKGVDNDAWSRSHAT